MYAAAAPVLVDEISARGAHLHAGNDEANRADGRDESAGASDRATGHARRGHGKVHSGEHQEALSGLLVHFDFAPDHYPLDLHPGSEGWPRSCS